MALTVPLFGSDSVQFSNWNKCLVQPPILLLKTPIVVKSWGKEREGQTDRHLFNVASLVRKIFNGV